MLSRRTLIRDCFETSVSRYLVTCSLAAALVCAAGTAVPATASTGQEDEAKPQSQQAFQDGEAGKIRQTADAERPIKRGNRALVGREIRSSNSEIIGEIENVVADTRGEIQYVVVSFDGFWGMGSDEAMVPIDKLDLTKNRHYVFFKGTEEELEMFPDYSDYGWAGKRYGSRPTAWYNTEEKLYDQEPEVGAIDGNPVADGQSGKGRAESRQAGKSGDVQAYSPAMPDKPGQTTPSQQRQNARSSDYGQGGYYSALENIHPSGRPLSEINWDDFGDRGVHASRLLDKTVQNGDGRKLGTVDDLLIGRDGRVRLVLDVGEATGEKDKRVQADLGDIRMPSGADHIVYDVSGEELKNDPNYTGDRRQASRRDDSSKSREEKSGGTAKSNAKGSGYKRQ